MKRLHRLVIVSFLGPFVMTFFIVLFLLLMQFLWRWIDELVGKGLGFKIISELLIYASSSLVPLALPLAILLSSLMTFGNMGEYYELTAMKSSGISLRRIMLPLVLLVTIISIGAFFFSNNVLPVTNLKMKSLLYDVKNQRPEVQIQAGVFYNGIDNYSIRVNRKNPVTNMLYDIKIYDHSAHKGNVSVTIADSGRMKMTADKRNLVVTLWSGYKYTELDEKRHARTRSFPHEEDKFGEQRIIIEMSGFELMRSDENMFRNSYTMLTVSQLDRACDSLKKELSIKSERFYKAMLADDYFKLHSHPDATLLTRTVNPQLPGFSENSKLITLPDGRKITREPRLTTPALIRRTEAAQQAGINQKDLKRKNDSIISRQPLLKIRNIDSLFRSFPPTKQLDIIRSALSNAPVNQYMVTSNASNMKYDVRFLRRHEIEWHRKFTLSIACLIFLFIGAPLGAIIRKGGLGMPTVISTLLFILYYIISITGEKFVRENVISSFNGMWISSFVLIIAGIFLTFEATNDSAILNIDSYISWIRDKLGLHKNNMLEKKAYLTGKFELIEIPREELQADFVETSKEADNCYEKVSREAGLFRLTGMILKETEFDFLMAFGVHYNYLIDKIILSPWFRHSYFTKRLGEFPYLDGRVSGNFFANRMIKTFSILFVPAWPFLLIHIWVRNLRLKHRLKMIRDLSSGMVNLLNSAAIRVDLENT